MDKLTEIINRSIKATEGPWYWKEHPDNEWNNEMPWIVNELGQKIMDFGDAEQFYPVQGMPPNEEDVQFIIHAREDIPFLLEYIKQQQQEIERLIKSKGNKFGISLDEIYSE